MNNEERIIGMLERVMQDLTGFQQKTNEQLDGLNGRIDGLANKFDALEQEVRIVRTTQENTVIPQIQLPAEGHTMISDQIKRLSVIDAMQMDIDTLKAAVGFLSNEVKELRKAM